MMMNNDSQGYFFHSNVSNWIFDWLKITFSFKSFYPDIKLFLISPTLFFLKFESRSQFKKAIIIGINGNTNWAFSKGVTTLLTIQTSIQHILNCIWCYMQCIAQLCFLLKLKYVLGRESEFNIFRDDVETWVINLQTIFTRDQIHFIL